MGFCGGKAHGEEKRSLWLPTLTQCGGKHCFPAAPLSRPAWREERAGGEGGVEGIVKGTPHVARN
jgi:hypothetical protein